MDDPSQPPTTTSHSPYCQLHRLRPRTSHPKQLTGCLVILKGLRFSISKYCKDKLTHHIREFKTCSDDKLNGEAIYLRCLSMECLISPINTSMFTDNSQISLTTPKYPKYRPLSPKTYKYQFYDIGMKKPDLGLTCSVSGESEP